LVKLAVQLVGTEQKITILSEGFAGLGETFVKVNIIGEEKATKDGVAKIDDKGEQKKQSKTRAKNVYEKLLTLLKAKGIKSSQIKKNIVGKG
jgi:hypothetical protein